MERRNWEEMEVVASRLRDTRNSNYQTNYIPELSSFGIPGGR